MRKYYEGDSLIGIALVFLAVSLGVFFRLYDLDIVSHWSDELATIYYSYFPNLIYKEETHPPGFYLLTKIITLFFGKNVLAIRYFVAIVSIILSSVCIYYGRKVFKGWNWVLLVILVFLNPADIIYARMARMYSPLIGLSFLFYLLSLLIPTPISFLGLISFIISWIFPNGFLIGLGYSIYEFIKSRSISRRCWVILASVVPVIIYYLSRLILNSKKGLISDYSGLSNNARNLIEDFFCIIAGDHFPKYSSLLFSPVVCQITAIVVSLLFFFYLYKRWKSKTPNDFDYSVFLILLVFVFTEAFSSVVVNIKMGRYFIFLIPLLFVQWVQISELLRVRQAFFLAFFTFFTLTFYEFKYLRPLDHYEWERESFTAFENYQTEFQSRYVFCGNKYQYFYYFNSPQHHCKEEFEKLREKKLDFVFIDMNGFMNYLVLPISVDYEIVDYSKVGSAILFKAHYKGKK